MTWRLASLTVLLAAIGCGERPFRAEGNGGSAAGGTAGTTGLAGASAQIGTAGTTGIAGAAATGGKAGGGAGDAGGTGGAGGDIGGTNGAAGVGGSAGGTGGTLPACDGAAGARDSVELAIVGPDGNPVAGAVSAAVTVASVDRCAAVTCPTSVSTPLPSVTTIYISADATRIVLTDADRQRWTMYLRNTTMPVDFIKVGDAFDLTIDAALIGFPWVGMRQTVVLAHASDLVLFAAASHVFITGASVPDLSAFQIDLVDGGAVCETGRGATPGSCGYGKRAARVTVAGESAAVPGGKTARVGWLSFTNGEMNSPLLGNSCDAASTAVMAGFRLP